MLARKDLQDAITVAAKGGLGSAVSTAAFQFTTNGWQPRPGCLTAGYSSSEAVLCSILLNFYFEMYGWDLDVVKIPEDRDFSNAVTDLIWPGAYYFVQAAHRMSERSAWEAIRLLLPGR